MYISQTITIFCTVFLISVALASVFNIPHSFLISISFFCLAVILFQKYLFIIAIFFFGNFLFHLHLEHYKFDESLLERNSYEAVVKSDLKQREELYEYKVLIDQKNPIFIKTDRDDLLYGETIIFSCDLYKPKAFDTFNYPRYLQLKKVLAACKTYDVIVTQEADFSLYGSMLKFKRKLVRVIESYIIPKVLWLKVCYWEE